MTITNSLLRTTVVFLSCLSTAWLVLLSTSISLYLKNQNELAHHYEVLYPFLWTAAGIASVVSLTYLVSHRFNSLQWLKLLVWFYYLTAALFIAISILRVADEAPLQVKYFVMLALLGAACFLAALAYRRIQLKKAVGFIALLSLMFIALDVIQFSLGAERNIPPYAVQNEPLALVDKNISAGGRLPNIYHIILDEYQTDLFLKTLDAETRRELAGFYFFPETTTLFGRTGMSMPSIFTGQAYDFKSPQYRYQHDAFNSKKSFLYSLQSAGYQTSAYIHKHYDFEQGLFEFIRYHDSNRKIPGYDHSAAFLKLWSYSNFPPPIAEKIVGQEYLDQQKSQNVLTPKKPIQSVETFRTIIDVEKRQSDSGRYVFAHLILPHFPYVLNEDCSHNDNLEETSPLSQSWCATNLTISFLQELKNLGRFDNSIIIIQSDHGARFGIKDDRIVNLRTSGRYGAAWSLARSRSLLLIKPLDSTSSLQTSRFPASLLDIAPTLKGMIGKESETHNEGFDLLANHDSEIKRIRYYHFFEKKGRNEWTDEMRRYRIENGHIFLEGKIELKNNPQWKPDI